MCGIAGIMNFTPGEMVRSESIQPMLDSMFHRGPDDQGIYARGIVGLGMRRLSIIDLEGGRQPISNEDGTLWIIYNGEIFNHEALRADLIRSGCRYKTHSDTETILHLFEEKGPACLEDLRGMFAFAIWDERKRSLFVARDRLGIKPLFYSHDDRRLIFGSELKALLALPDVKREIDWTALDAYFAYGYIPAPWTAYKGIQKLLPGHYMIVDQRGVLIHSYWDLYFEPKRRASESDLMDEFLFLLKESVRMRLMSEVPLGCFLSGGVDSSFVTALMSEMMESPVKTFTIGFGGQKGNFLDEREYAREVSRRYQTDHQEFQVLPEIEHVIDLILHAFDEPFSDDSVIPTYYICKMAREKVTVALTGLGGDENFAGYERYLGFWMSEIFEGLPQFIRERWVKPVVSRLKEGKGGHYRINHLKRFIEADGLSLSHRFQRYISPFSPTQREMLYLPMLRKEIDFDAVERIGRKYFDQSDAEDPIDRALYQDIKMYLPDDILALTDRLGMHHSLELRVPFVDHKLMEFCAKIPSNLKIRWGRKKYLLKKAAASYLPASVIRHRKQGFGSPMAIWLRTDMMPYVDRILAPERIDAVSVLNPMRVREILTAHQERRSLNDKQIFSLIIFQRWLETKSG